MNCRVPETRFDRQPQTHHIVTGPSNPIHHMVTGPSNPNHHMVTGPSNPNHHMVTGPSNPNHHMVAGHSNPNHHMVTGPSNPNHHMVTGRSNPNHHIVTGPSNPNHHMVTGPSNPNHHMVAGHSNPNHHMVTGPSNPNHHMVTGPSNPNHHMVTGPTAQTNQFPEFLTGRIVTPRNSPSHQYQNLSTQVPQDNNLPVVEQTPRNQNSDANNSINRLAEATAGIATQQRPQAATMLKPVSANTLIFDGKNGKFELFEDLFHTMLKMQPEMTEAIKINQF